MSEHENPNQPMTATPRSQPRLEKDIDSYAAIIEQKTKAKNTVIAQAAVSIPPFEVQPGDGTERLLKWFEFSHLPPALRVVSSKYSTMAKDLVDTIMPGPERTIALRKLLESKDAAVRA